MFGIVALALDQIIRVVDYRPPPPDPEASPAELEQLRRQHHVAIPLSLALLDPEHHALAVDVGHLQVGDFGHPEACAVGDAERGLVLEARRGLEERATSSWLRTTGALRGSVTIRRGERDRLSSVRVKKTAAR